MDTAPATVALQAASKTVKARECGWSYRVSGAGDIDFASAEHRS